MGINEKGVKFMNISEVISYIKLKEFELLELDFDESHPYLFFSKEQFNLVVCSYKNKININELNDEVQSIRTKLIRKNINIWNTYMLILFENEINFDEAFLIEKNASSLRKYVITSMEDFKRIPFLDNVEFDNNGFSTTEKISTISYTENLQRVINFIQENNGENEKFKANYIRSKVPLLFDLEEESYED